jgi:hypothetical protein
VRSHVLALIVVFAAELLAFSLGVQRYYAWIHPRWFDQNQYLMEAYNAYDVARAHGFAAGAGFALGHPSPQGALHAFFSLLVFELVGPSRLAALSLNLLGLVALQLASFGAVSKLSRSRALGWAAVGALAALNVPWSGHWGSAIDFRLDWMAACAFGVALSVGLMGRGFRSTPWACLFGAAVGVTMLVRFLTAVYFSGIFVVLLAWLCIEEDRLRRCGRLFLSGIVAAAVAGWAFWRNRQLIYNYYWTGHYGSPEGVVRGTHQDALASVTWMVNESLLRQLGLAAGLICLGVWGCLLFSGRRGEEETGEFREEPGSLRDAWILSAVFLLVPMGVLLTHPEKAEPPADLLATSGIWLLFLAWISVSRGVSRRVVTRIGAVAAVAGAFAFGFYQLRRTTSPDQITEYRETNALSDFLYYRSQEAGIESPLVSISWTLDSLNGGAFRILGYERHGHILHFMDAFPTSILEVPRAVVFGQFSQSTFVCVVTRAPATWPIDRQMASMAPELMRWCGANMVHDGDINSPEISASIFERKGLDGPESPVSLAAFLQRESAGAPQDVPLPPSKPWAHFGSPVLWPVGTDIHYHVGIAYSPYTVTAVDLPAGLSLDAESGELTGKFREPGDFVVELRATNAVGESEIQVPFRAIKEDWTAVVTAPSRAKEGVPARIEFTAFDAQGSLDFIDLTDLTEVKVLARIEASDSQRTAWQGSYRFVSSHPGTHNIIARTVRYEPKAGAYSFVDRLIAIDVRP